jgi:5'-deoxynucleotidase YfbR-like HD superfamily hydrolase
VSVEARPYALLHDAHEAFLGDWSSPVKAALDALGAGFATRHLVDLADRAVYRACSLPWPPPPLIEAEVKHADRVALATERRDLLDDCSIDWGDLPPPYRRAIRDGWDWGRAATEFLSRAQAAAALGQMAYPKLQ